MTAMIPKNPVPLLLLGGLLLLASRKTTAQASRTNAAAAVPTRAAGIDYSTPTAVAEKLAQVVNRLTRGTPIKADPQAAGTVEMARNAVRAGDTYYGAGSVAWYANNNDAAREAVRAGDAYYGGWSSPTTVPVTTVTASGSTQDSQIVADVYDPAVDADRWAGIGWGT